MPMRKRFTNAAMIPKTEKMAVSHGRPIDDFIHATFNVPTYSEAYKYAAYDGLQALARAEHAG
jgi:hypothetical protein